MRRVTYHKGNSEAGGPYELPTWTSSDVVGVAADFDSGTLLFGVNGTWKEVFTGVAGLAEDGAFPSLMLSNGACLLRMVEPFECPGPSEDFGPVVVATAEAPARLQLERWRGPLQAFTGSFDVSG